MEKDSNERPLVIAVVGKSGVGKSTLINNFLGLKGNDACATGDGASTTTLKITTKESKKQNITVRMIDTPGLGGINELSMVEVCKDLIKKTEQNIDVLLYCVSRHPSACIDTTDVEIIRTLTSVFGPEIWSHTIFALTFTDAATNPNTEQDTQIYSYAKLFQKALNKAGVINVSVQSEFSEKEEPSSIPVIPVGCSSSKHPFTLNWESQLLNLMQAQRKSNSRTRLKMQMPPSQAVQAAEFAGSVMAGIAIGAAVGTAIGAPFLGIGTIIGPVAGAVVGAVAGFVLSIAKFVYTRQKTTIK